MLRVSDDVATRVGQLETAMRDLQTTVDVIASHMGLKAEVEQAKARGRRVEAEHRAAEPSRQPAPSAPPQPMHPG